MKISIACAIAVALMPALFADIQNPGTATRASLFDGKTEGPPFFGSLGE
jgi:hypothetical protein